MIQRVFGEDARWVGSVLSLGCPLVKKQKLLEFSLSDREPARLEKLAGHLGGKVYGPYGTGSYRWRLTAQTAEELEDLLVDCGEWMGEAMTDKLLAAIDYMKTRGPAQKKNTPDPGAVVERRRLADNWGWMEQALAAKGLDWRGKPLATEIRTFVPK